MCNYKNKFPLISILMLVLINSCISQEITTIFFYLIFRDPYLGILTMQQMVPYLTSLKTEHLAAYTGSPTPIIRFTLAK